VDSTYAEEAHVIRILSNRWSRRSAITAGILALMLGAGAWYLHIFSFRDVRAYYGMSRECDPVWQELALRRIKPGNDVEELIARTSPARVIRHDEYTTILYHSGGGICFTQVSVVAKEGRLISAVAASCTWDHTFFEEMTPEDQRDYLRSFDSKVEQELDEQRQADLHEKP
jgi:hypothetical protein